MLHKPAGLVSATEDPRQPTVLELLPEHLRRVGLFPAGRLDKDTEGLLLLTNDGPLAHRLLSPRHHVDKTYFVPGGRRAGQGGRGGLCRRHDPGRRAGVPARRAGAAGHAGYRHCHPAGGQVPHQIKRMLAARGKPVVYLKRLTWAAVPGSRPGEGGVAAPDGGGAGRHPIRVGAGFLRAPAGRTQFAPTT